MPKKPPMVIMRKLLLLLRKKRKKLSSLKRNGKYFSLKPKANHGFMMSWLIVPCYWNGNGAHFSITSIFILYSFFIINNYNNKYRGTYYDPQNIFCGQYDCYKILGFDFESWGRSPPSKKELTQSYRNMSKQWHPDKNKDKGAKARFVVSFIYLFLL